MSVKVDEAVYRKLFPEASLAIVEGAGHYVHTDKPKITVEAIAHFLEAVEKNDWFWKLVFDSYKL